MKMYLFIFSRIIINRFPNHISTRPTYLQRKSSRISIHIQNLSCEVEVLVFSRFHRLRIEFIGIDSSGSDELISWTTIEEGERDSFSEKLRNLLTINASDRSCESRFYMREILLHESFRKSPREFLWEYTHNEFLRVTLELILQKTFPFY